MNEKVDNAWLETKGRRVLKEYPSFQEMLDDIWEAHEHGWLPISMTEQPRSETRLWPLSWFRKETNYVVAFRNSDR